MVIVSKGCERWEPVHTNEDTISNLISENEKDCTLLVPQSVIQSSPSFSEVLTEATPGYGT